MWQLAGMDRIVISWIILNTFTVYFDFLKWEISLRLLNEDINLFSVMQSSYICILYPHMFIMEYCIQLHVCVFMCTIDSIFKT